VYGVYCIVYSVWCMVYGVVIQERIERVENKAPYQKTITSVVKIPHEQHVPVKCVICVICYVCYVLCVICVMCDM